MDKKSAAHWGAGIAALLMLGVLFYQTRQLGMMQEKLDIQQKNLQDLSHQVGALSGDINRIQYEVRQELEAQGSLFESVETDLSYWNGKLSIDVRAIPKEVSPDETILFSLTDGDGVALKRLGDGPVFTGRLACSMQETLSPVLTLLSGESQRHEVLPPLSPNEMLRLSYDAQVGDELRGDYVQVLMLNDNEVFTPQDLRKAVAILTVRELVTGATQELTMTADPAPTRDAVFTCDLSRFYEKSGIYTVSLTLTMADGLVYHPEGDEPLSSFDHDDQGNGSGAYVGGGILLPDFTGSH